MSDMIAEFSRKMREGMLEDVRDKYGDIFFERWQNPLYMDAMADPDVIALLKGSCGDSMLMFMKFENGIVQKTTFKTEGCATSIVCGSFAAELSLGKTAAELLEITGETILKQFGGLPSEQQHCAIHAAATIHKAANQYIREA